VFRKTENTSTENKSKNESILSQNPSERLTIRPDKTIVRVYMFNWITINADLNWKDKKTFCNAPIKTGIHESKQENRLF